MTFSSDQCHRRLVLVPALWLYRGLWTPYTAAWESLNVTVCRCVSESPNAICITTSSSLTNLPQMLYCCLLSDYFYFCVVFNWNATNMFSLFSSAYCWWLLDCTLLGCNKNELWHNFSAFIPSYLLVSNTGQLLSSAWGPAPADSDCGELGRGKPEATWTWAKHANPTLSTLDQTLDLLYVKQQGFFLNCSTKFQVPEVIIINYYIIIIILLSYLYSEIVQRHMTRVVAFLKVNCTQHWPMNFLTCAKPASFPAAIWPDSL